MHLVCYLAHDDQYIPAVQERLSLAQPAMGLVTARSVPELLNRAQTLPIHAVLADVTWPRATWQQLRTDLRQLQLDLPVFALSGSAFDDEWWQYADELLRLDENVDLFHYRIQRSGRASEQKLVTTGHDFAIAPTATNTLTSTTFTSATDAPGLLELPQFRQFAELFSGLDEPELVEAFIAWVQPACQTSRAVLLLQDQQTGNFHCRAQRGLPSALVPHCTFAQTTPLCRWLATTGRILLKEQSAGFVPEVVAGMELLQAVAVVPIIHDGQLVGILGLGPRLIGNGYSAAELEGMYAIAGQIAVAIHHCRMHRAIKAQQEFTEHVLGVMPTGTVVLDHEHRIAFVNTAAAVILGKPRATLIGMDLRALPSPLGDLAYESLVHRIDLPRQELELGPQRHPTAVTCFPLATTNPSAMLMIEDLSTQKDLRQERERRVDLEVVTNLVHYLAHELRNPLVTLSTFSNLAPTRAGDADFQEFCDTVLQPEVNRINLSLEQLLVLTHHAEFQFTEVDLAAMLEHVTGSSDMRAAVVTAIPLTLPMVYGDAHRLETAFTCILRSACRLGNQHTPTTLRVDVDAMGVVMHVEVPISGNLATELLLNPWQQLLSGPDHEVDLGVATAQYILEQHQGSLVATVQDEVLTIVCRLPVRSGNDSHEEMWRDAKESARR